jgi:3-dehydroquinate synthase
MQQLQVKVPGGEATRYPVVIGSGVLGTLWPQIKAAFSDRHRFLVSDEHVVAAGHMDTLLGDRRAPHYIIRPAGETSKNIDTAVAIIEEMEKACLGRDTVVVALGGGTVGDVAGFAAAIFKRGVPVVQIPTTTLAQADSAIGGKTGVDSSLSKNAFGAFWHPAAVYIDVDTLRTLDERQYRAGLVESIKHGLIADAEYFEFFENHLDAILDRQPETLTTMARYNCTIKGHVVEADPQEQNQRRALNYGHTVGHAIEAAGGYSLLHGEAVALGILAAGLIEAEMGLAEPNRLDRIRRVFEKLGLPLQLSHDLAEDKVLDIMKRDKKAVDKWPRFVLIGRLGRVHCPDGQYAVDVSREVVERVLEKLR